MAAEDDFQQYLLEMINRARMDPVGEAKRFGITLNQGLAPGTITAAPKQVLAWNASVEEAADNHSAWMLQHDRIQIAEPAGFAALRTGQTAADRMTAAGYAFNGPVNVAELVGWRAIGSPSSFDAEAMALAFYRWIMLDPQRRATMLNSSFSEIGVGIERGTLLASGASWHAGVVTQDFAANAGQVFVTGVIYFDGEIEVETQVNQNNRYDFREGWSNASVEEFGTANVAHTSPEGGYSLAFAPNAGLVTLRFNTWRWNGWDAFEPETVLVELEIGASNVKIDIGEVVTTNTSVSTGMDVYAIGTAPISISGGQRVFGNSGNNTLATTGTGINILDGRGGADLMRGGNGDDRYYVESAGDKIDELGTDGEDTVYSSVNFSLANPTTVQGDVERLILIGKAKNGAGNDLDNFINGNGQANLLNGRGGQDTLRGGTGNDVLIGGADADIFHFTHRPNSATNRDTIRDFNRAQDIIYIEDTSFRLAGGLGPIGPEGGTLIPGFFRAGSRALDANDYFVYNRANGVLLFDPDGSGSGAAIHMATFVNRPALTFADVFVV